MKKFISKGAALLIVLILLVADCLEAEAQVCRSSSKIRGKKPPPGECNKDDDSDCCVEGKLYTTYKCSPKCLMVPRPFLRSQRFPEGTRWRFPI